MLVERKIINLRVDVYGKICTVVTQCFDSTRANGLAYNPRFWAFIERHDHVAEFGVVSNPNDELPVKMLEFHVNIPERMPDIQAVLNKPAIPLHSAIQKLVGGRL
tara:strand:+ start:912 stop:1226 length:315 start_codon:yes stop_codon:yes gene_type:complete